MVKGVITWKLDYHFLNGPKSDQEYGVQTDFKEKGIVLFRDFRWIGGPEISQNVCAKGQGVF